MKNIKSIKVNRNIAVFVILIAVIAVVALMSFRAADPPKYTNLKVLPKDISSHDLQSIMADDFEDGLGVSCGFCHANNKDGHGLDFASDAKAEKQITRTMMQMTLGINKKYLKLKHPKLGDAALVVSCTTCHKGQPFPDGAEPK